MKRFACQDVIPGCDQVFTGADDQSVLDQVIAHAAMDHGLVKPPMALVELVVATTHSFVPQRCRGHLRLVGEGAGDDDVLGRSDERVRESRRAIGCRFDDPYRDRGRSSGGRHPRLCTISPVRFDHVKPGRAGRDRGRQRGGPLPA